MLPTDLPHIDPAILVPHWSPSDALRVAGYFLVTAWLPGASLCRLLGWRLAGRAERWALAAVVGTLWTSFGYFLLGLMAFQRWHLLPTLLPVAILAVRWLGRRRGSGAAAGARPAWQWPRWNGWEAAALGLVVVFAAWHVVRVGAGLAYDESGLRLYGAWYSDKLVNMSPAAALMHEVPPRSLRMAGEPFPYHFFPHVFVAAAARDTGVDFINVFWFHAAAIGIIIVGLAAIGFCRRMLRSYGQGCLGLAFFGLTFFTTKMRPLDLSIPLLLLGLGAIDRWQCGGRRRWAVLAVVLLGTMPLYEVFHGLTVLAGLGLWWLATDCVPRLARRLSRLLWRAPTEGWSATRTELSSLAPGWIPCTVLMACVFAAAMGSVKLTMLGAPVVGQTKFLVKSSYRDSFKHRCAQALDRGAAGSSWLAMIMAWRQGQSKLLPPGVARSADPRSPGLIQRAAAEGAFDVGLMGYVLIGFVNVALGGLATLIVRWRAVRPSRWPASHGVVAAMALFGFLLPAVLTWGHLAGGEFNERLEFWETPNLYRPTTLAWLLLVLLAPPAIIAAVRRLLGAANPCSIRGSVPSASPRLHCLFALLLLALAGEEAFVLLRAAVAAEKSFHLVPRDQLQALAFLRTAVPFGDVVLHPWGDEQIRDAKEPDKAAWIYKRHFTLGSNFAGQRMWYEGREDQLFIGGFIRPEDVYHRRRVRKEFYEGSPSEAVLREVLVDGHVRWIVADRDHPAPPLVRAAWTSVLSNRSVTIYRSPNPRPELQASHL